MLSLNTLCIDHIYETDNYVLTLGLVSYEHASEIDDFFSLCVTKVKMILNLSLM